MNMKTEKLRDAIITMAIEGWRLELVFERLLRTLDVKEQARYKSKISWFMKRSKEALEMAELKMVNLSGQIYDPGLAATPINIDEFDASDRLYVEQTLEPVIMDEEGNVIKTGTISLRKVV